MPQAARVSEQFQGPWKGESTQERSRPWPTLASSPLCSHHYDSYYSGVTDPKLTSLPSLMKKYIGKDKDTSCWTWQEVLGEESLFTWEFFFLPWEGKTHYPCWVQSPEENLELWEKDQEMNETQLAMCSIHLLQSRCQSGTISCVIALLPHGITLLSWSIVSSIRSFQLHC